MGDMIKYADDTNLSEYIPKHSMTSVLQSMADTVTEWSQYNKFQVNPSKCKEMFITFQRNPPQFDPVCVNVIIIESVKEIKILGLGFN